MQLDKILFGLGKDLPIQNCSVGLYLQTCTQSRVCLLMKPPLDCFYHQKHGTDSGNLSKNALEGQIS